jgi:hypothetical protein
MKANFTAFAVALLITVGGSAQVPLAFITKAVSRLAARPTTGSATSNSPL